MEEIDKILTGNELFPVFQPVVSLENGDIFGYEALTRTESNSVLHFFKKADKEEKSWQLEKLCRKLILKNARRMGIKSHISVNINPDIMSDEDFHEGYTKKLLEKYSIDPHKIILEITEYCSKKDSSLLSEIINHYKIQNFKIALDNVGSAYSGLERICVLNPDFIKIDMNIIRGIESDEIKKSMVKSLVQFCRESGILLIAVGVESASELDFLLRTGVNFAQGFFIGKPEIIPGKVSAQAYARIIAHKKNLEVLNKSSEDKSEKKKEKKSQKKENKHSISEDESLVKDLKNPMENKREIGYIAQEGVTVFPDMSVPDLMNFFTSNENCTIVTVVDIERKVLGVMSRSYLSDLLGGRFGFGLNYRKTVGQVLIKDFLSIDFSESVEKAASKAMMRTDKNLYEPVIIEKNGIYAGMVTVKTLLDSIISVEVKERTLELTKKNRLLQNQRQIQERDMKMAELVQKSLYQSDAPCKNGWKSAFVFKPMSSVSGDLYDFYYDKNGDFIGTGLFDVSGHGVASGLVGILSKYLAEKIFISGKNKPLEKIIQNFSETLAEEKGSVENYLTGLFLRIDGKNVEYVNAGHTDVILKKSGMTETEILGGESGKFRGMFVGLSGLPSDLCSTVKYTCKKDDTFVLFTDCLLESRNLAGDEMGLKRLREIISKAPDGTPEEILSYILDIFNAFTEAVPVRDDLTVIVLKYYGNESKDK